VIIEAVGPKIEPLRNLVLVHEPDVQDFADLEAIAREVRQLAPDIEVFVASNDTASSTTRKLAARRPTLIYSPTVLRRFRPLRGKVYAGALITKDLQVQRLSKVGLSVPDFAVLNEDFEFDPDRFGPIVLIKPTGFTSHGGGIEMVRSEELVGTRWRQHPAVRAAGSSLLMVQRFIDTGNYPAHYRVLTFFGQPIFAFKAVSTAERPSLNASSKQLAAGPFMAKHGQRQLVVPVEPDVLEFASRTFAAISEVALHGCDVIREVQSDSLYILEVNPGGNTWSFSSQWASMLRTELNMPDLSKQFDAWKTCAQMLVRHTLQEAV
jgi:hypothetical protein